MAKARFFYALRPDAATAERLAALAAQVAARWGGRAFVADDLHLTLAFVGMRPIDEQPSLEAILRGLPSRLVAGADPQRPPLALSRLGSFGHGVLWIGPPAREGPPDFVHRLADEVRARLRAARIDFDDRPLKLHATLVRGARGFDASGRGQAHPQAPAPGSAAVPRSETYVAREWSLALGAADPASTPQRRYRWSHPEPDRMETV